MDAVTTEMYKGMKIETFYDTDATSPRIDQDNLGTMICWHSRYTLGDKHDYEDTSELFSSLIDEREEYTSEKILKEIEDSIDADYFKKGAFYKEYHRLLLVHLETHFILLPLFLYDHSGITISTNRFSCGWDSGQVGWLYISLEKVRKEYNLTEVTDEWREKIITYLVGEVECYDQYLTGQVFGFRISKEEKFTKVFENSDKEDIDGVEFEEVDSCRGFYGEKYCLEEAKSSVDCLCEGEQE